MDLRDARTTAQERVRALEDILMDVAAAQFERVDARLALPDARAKFQAASESVRRAESKLDVRAKQRLQTLLNSPYIRARMNALAAKLRLRERLRARKFEFERVERPFRNQSNGT